MTLTPTKAAGATATPNDVLYVDPAAETRPDDARGQFADTGLNPMFFRDLMSAMLAHERCGTHLYRSVAGRTQNPVLKQNYEHFGEETARHVEILEQLIATAGGNPNYISATARAVEAMDSRILETTFILSGSLDVMNAEMAMLDAVFLAETIDHANWHNLSTLVESMQTGQTRNSFQTAIDEVEEQEDQHLEWARNTKARLLTVQAETSLTTTIEIKAEELVARVRDWLS